MVITERELAAIHPALRLKPTKRARRVTLRLNPKERHVDLVVPLRYKKDAVLTFAYDHSGWIMTQLAKLPRPVPFTHGAEIPLFGTPHKLDITLDSTLNSTSITLKNNKLTISTPRDDVTSFLTRFLKKECRKRLQILADEKAAAANLHYTKISVRDTVSRWGSCSHEGHLSFSWRLIFAPYAALDYLVAHETAHLCQMNHGPAFWSLCEELACDYKEGKSWIRKNGHTLLRYGARSS